MYKLTKREYVDSISIPIMSIAKNVILYHKVKLSRPNLDGERDYYHKEFTYRSKYKEPEKLTTLRLSHSSILTIENKNSDGYESMVINITNRDFIVESFSTILPFFDDEEVKLFVENKEGRFVVNPKLRKKTIISFEANRLRLVTVRPHVIVYDEDLYDPIEGVLINLTSQSLSSVEVPYETFKTLIRIIDRFDFHTSGLAALTYLQCAEIGKYEIDIVKTSLSDFDEDMEPVYKVKKYTESENDSTSKLETRKSTPLKTFDRGW